MIEFNIYPGFVGCAKRTDGKTRKPFTLDLSKFPSLFIDYNYIVAPDVDMDRVTNYIKEKCMTYEPEDHVKCVVIDGYGVAYNSIMKPGTYRRDRCDTMVKRLNTYVSKIYEEYLKDPEHFIPRTKYIILVCRIGGMEEDLISLMSKLGAIGVYLILADDAASIRKFPELCAHLYGKLTYVDSRLIKTVSGIEYNENYFNNLGLAKPRYVYTLERFRLQPEIYPVICPRCFYRFNQQEFPNIRTWITKKNEPKFYLKKPLDLSIF